MFAPFGKGAHGNGVIPHRGRQREVEEDYGDAYQPPASDKPDKDPDYWRVKLPSDELDRQMWGDGGLPPPAVLTAPPADSSPPRRREEDAETGGCDGGDNDVNDDNDDSDGNDDNDDGGDERAGKAADDEQNDDKIVSTEVSPEERQEESTIDPPPAAPDKVILEDIVWKQRSGFGKYSLGIMQHEWEQRRVVLFESGMLRYYTLDRNMEGTRFNPEPAPGTYDGRQESRGEMYLREDREDSDDSEGDNRRGGHPKSPSGIKRLHNLVSSDKGSGGGGGVKVQARERQSDPGPTPYEIDITRKDNNTMWRFCFQSQSIQIEWLSALKSVASDGGETSDDDSLEGASEGLANHGFQPGDHIIRWEMLPVLYPIQIHGIVLETGKNLVIIADFGLSSYNNKSAGANGLDTFEGKDDSHDIIMAAWEKIKPKTKRLNIQVVTERREIRKWSKINYKDQQEKKEKKKKGFFKSLFQQKKEEDGKDEVDEVIDETTQGSGDHEEGDCVKSANGDAGGATSAAEDNVGPAKQIDVSDNHADDDCPGDSEELDTVEGEPEWAQPGYRSRKRAGSNGSTSSATCGGQSVFSIDRPYDHSKNELPKSDSVKLVLARTHFILENQDLLPPYHVSNLVCDGSPRGHCDVRLFPHWILAL